MALPFRRAAILGVGLIGGSLALALRRHAPEIEIVGLDAPDVLERAVARGAIHRGAAGVDEAVRGCDLVVLAAPIGANRSLLRAAASHLEADTLVTDTGSVKGPIARDARGLVPEGALFVGGHPMTGSEHRGIGHADALLYENAVYVVCPTDRADSADPRFRALTHLLERVGSKVLEMDPDRHDRSAAAVSHLPQLLAVLLVNQLAEPGIRDDVPALLAAGGFRDMTRIASSPFSVWNDILEANHDEVLAALDRFAEVFGRLRERLGAGDLEAVARAFAVSASVRESVPARTKGFLEPLCDVYVYTRDEPGALRRITGAVTDGGVNIKDIELLKIREGTGGTFRLGVDDPAAADHTIEVLAAAGFQAYRL